MTKTLININGEIREASSVKMPPSGREFRNAWQFNGDVIEVDMAKARDLKIDRLVSKATERAQRAEERKLKKALREEDATAEEAEAAKFKRPPQRRGVRKVQNAATPEALDALSEDDIFE